MTIIKAFEKIFSTSTNIIDSDLFGVECLKELKQFNNDLFHTELILDIIRFFAKEYGVDLLPMYKDYMSKCNNFVISKANEILEGVLENE